MAIIYSYPKKLNPQGSDVFIITDPTTSGANKNRTKSVDLDAISTYVVTSTSAVTGSGTSGRIPKWLPDGSLGDSFIKQEIVAASNIVTIDGVFGFQNTLNCDLVSAPNILATNITATSGGAVIISGDMLIGDNGQTPPDGVRINSFVLDSTGTGSTAAGEVLVSNAAGQLVWAGAPGGGIGGSGTVGTIPVFTAAGTIGDSTITDQGGETIFSSQVRFDDEVEFDGGEVKSFQDLKMLDGASIEFVSSVGPPVDAKINSVVGSGKLNIDGSLQLDDYGSGTITGTAAYGLSVDGSGNVIETANSNVAGDAAYIASWTQTGFSDPVPTEIYNNTGATFTWTRVNQGNYLITASSAVFTASKTFYNVQGVGTLAATQIVQPSSINTTEARYRAVDVSTGATADTNSGWIEIRVYP